MDIEISSSSGTSSWVKLIIGSSVERLELVDESHVWVEYDPSVTFGDMLVSMKGSLGIKMDVGLYLQGFYLLPHLSTSLLHKVPEPVIELLPSGQTKKFVHDGVDQQQLSESAGTQTWYFNQETNTLTLARDEESTTAISPMEFHGISPLASPLASLTEAQPSCRDTSQTAANVSPSATTPARKEQEEQTITTDVDVNMSNEKGSRAISEDITMYQPRRSRGGRKAKAPNSAEKENGEQPSLEQPTPVRRSRRLLSSLNEDSVDLSVLLPMKRRKRGSPRFFDENSPSNKRLKSSSPCSVPSSPSCDSGASSMGTSPDIKPQEKRRRGRPGKKTTSKIVVKPVEPESEVESTDVSTPNSSCGQDSNGILNQGFVETNANQSSNAVRRDPYLLDGSPNARSSLHHTSERTLESLAMISTPSPDEPSESQNETSTVKGILTSADELNPGDVFMHQAITTGDDMRVLTIPSYGMVIGKEGQLLTVAPPSAITPDRGVSCFDVFVMDFSTLNEPRRVSEEEFQLQVALAEDTAPALPSMPDLNELIF